MNAGPISRRGLVAGGAAVLGVVALPAGVVAAVAGTPSGVDPGALPAVFDPRAFCNDLIDAGYRIHASRPVWCGFEDEDLRPYYAVRPPEGRGFGRSYSAVMTKWAEAIDACPDNVEQVVAYAFGQSGG